MRKFSLFPLAAILGFCTLANTPALCQTNSMEALDFGQNQFALDFYANLKSREGNLFFSPYSISTCLGMTYVGARGETAKQMAHTLHFNVAPTEIAAPMGQLEKYLNGAQSQRRGFELNTANGLWTQEGHPFLPAFIQTAQQDFGASVKQVDFRTQFEPVRIEINNWVSHKTRGKITDLFPKGSLDPNSRLVLVNAIYFKGQWMFPFKTNDTANAPFFIRPDSQVQCRMMHMEHEFLYYAETRDLQILELPYVSGPDAAPLSMVFLLPARKDGINALEKELNTSNLHRWMLLLRGRKVKVFIPKFKTTREFDLGNTLATMGMRDAFTGKADFSGMDGMRDLFITAVVHKAYVDVYEEGTEAAAATGVAVGALAIERPKPVPVFRADHPLIFFIRDTRSGNILFLGRVNNPTQ